MPPPAELESRRATIGRIDIYVQNIFDLDDPREDKRLYRLANGLHYKTRARTVRNQLLFAPGEVVSRQRIEETERILRSRVYLSEAWVVPTHYDAATNTADLAVTVRDVWTLNPYISLGRAGGSNRGAIGIQEENLLGTGSKFEIVRSHDVDRTATLFELANPNLGGSWWQGAGSYSNNSDGHTASLSLEQPFYALATRRARGLDAFDGTSKVSLYSNGVIAEQFTEHHALHQLYAGWSDGIVGDWIRRWTAGLRYDEASFSTAVGGVLLDGLPQDRKFVYPYVGWQLLENRYETAENVDLIGRTEDLYVGRSLYAELGYSTPAFGGLGHSVLAQLTANEGFHLRDATQLFASAALSGRVDDGSARNVILTGAARLYERLTRRDVTYVSLSAATTHQLDADTQLLLGGDNGLRGYPIRFQGGTSSALLTIEQRRYTDWFPFRLMRVAGVVFLDSGRTWGRDFAGAEPLGLLTDVGIGIRLGNVRSGLGNVLHLDLSYALNAPQGVRRVQVTFQTQGKF